MFSEFNVLISPFPMNNPCERVEETRSFEHDFYYTYEVIELNFRLEVASLLPDQKMNGVRGLKSSGLVLDRS
jgi:hypothetical protein